MITQPQQPSLWNRMAGYFNRYVAAEASNKRRDPGTRIQSSDAVLDTTKRKRLTSGAIDLQRNYSVAAWAIRKHLDYVSSFTFQSTTQDAAFNLQLEALMKWWSRPLNCDVAQRHSFRRMIRLAEASRVIHGDVFLVKFSNGRMQAIEGDRVRDPSNRRPDETWIHGVKIGRGGQLQRVMVHRRNLDGSYVEERDVSAGNVIQLGYFESFDQVRGVSPLASAIVDFQDCLEVKDYARAKAKITQLFALAITREMADADEETGGDEYQVDLGKGPVKVELDPGDKMEFLESRHPSTEFQSFIVMCLQAALKSLDIPWSFFDESYTNFFGSRSALIQYLQSCRAKREDLREMLDRITVWKILQWVGQGFLTLPAGYTVDDLQWDWVPAGVPWWNPEQEINGDVMAISNKLRTRSEIRRERYGDDWRDVVIKLRQEDDFLKANGFDPATTEQAPAGAPAATDEIEDDSGELPSEDDEDDGIESEVIE